MAERWNAGETIILQEVWRERLWSARPLRVVEDHGDTLLLWCPQGTRWKTATTPPTRPRLPTRAERFVTSLSRGDWILGDFTWDVSTLSFLSIDDWYAIWVSWQGDNYLGWYVNLQRPFRRTARSVQTMDLMLDILVAPDRRWQWKDEDEFAALADAGLLTATEAAKIRDEGQRAIESMKQGRPPFDKSWHDWRPDPTWTVPELPPGWDHL